jgi:hypothetical protein
MGWRSAKSSCHRDAVSGHLGLCKIRRASPRRPRPANRDDHHPQRRTAGHYATVGPDGKFTVPVIAGTFTVTGRSPYYQHGSDDCPAGAPVTATLGRYRRCNRNLPREVTPSQ